MHTQFLPYLRQDRMGIDYSAAFFQQYDTFAELEKIYVRQHPGGEKMIRSAMQNSNLDNLRYVLENAKRIRLDKANPELFAKGQKFLQEHKK